MKTWTEVADVIDAIRYKDWCFRVEATGTHNEVFYLQAVFFANGMPQHGRKWLLSLRMTRSEIVQTALMAVLACEEHEARERFLYQGKSIFGPHIDVDAFTEISDRLDARVATA